MQTQPNQSSVGPQMYALKKAIEAPQQSVMKLLESTQLASAPQNTTDVSHLTGLGSKLDIKA